MPWNTINDAIVSTLQTVPGIGKVYPFKRFITSDKAFQDTYSVDGVLNAWEVSRTSFTQMRIERNVRSRSPLSNMRMTHFFTLYGYYGLTDDKESELSFQALIESVTNTFRGNVTLNDTADWIEGMNATTIEWREFYGSGVHYAELLLPAIETLEG